MKIVVSGASGLIGTRLVDYLTEKNHTVLKLVRKQSHEGIKWDPERETIEADKLEGVDAIVNLAGESVAQRWSGRTKQKILDSRIKGTRLLANTINKLKTPPKAFLCASAIGMYGDRGDEELTESSTPGNGFLSQVCQQWESAAKEAKTRVALCRFGIVLDARGGVLGQMLPPFKMGAGGPLGSGKQYMSWIDIHDTVEAIEFIIKRDQMSGAYNFVAPNPVTNIEFTKTLSAVVGHPALIPVPVAMTHLVFGKEMADELLFASLKVLPKRLTETGFQFQLSDLESSLRQELAK